MGGETDASGPRHVVICDAGDEVRPDMTTVAALCRLILHARRSGIEARVRHASPELRDLLELAGLDEVIACD